MDFLESITLGVIQGFTEFLPISSSGHLVIAQNIFGIKQPGNEFEILLHMGTLLSIIFVFFKDIRQIVATLHIKNTQRFILNVAIGTLPAAVIGIMLKENIVSLFDNVVVVGYALVFTGLILISSYFFKKKNKKISIGASLLIGCAQAVAIIPGISRSGMTITLALFLGVESKQAAKYSFMLAIPVISGAGLLMSTNLNNSFNMDISIYIAGLASSFIIGVISLKWLLGWLETGKFYYFGIYCFIMGLFTIVS